jgi:hypothetical protein
VRVSIGRVVVRAVHEAEQPPSKAVERPWPSLSLDDYLKGSQGDEA